MKGQSSSGRVARRLNEEGIRDIVGKKYGEAAQKTSVAGKFMGAFIRARKPEKAA